MKISNHYDVHLKLKGCCMSVIRQLKQKPRKPQELAFLCWHQWWLLSGKKKKLWKPGHRGKCLLPSGAQRPAVEVHREPGLIALIIQSRNSFCPHEGGWTVPILAAEHRPCFPPRDICSPVVIKVP